MIDIRHTTITQLELIGSSTIDRHDVQRAGEALASALADGNRAVLLLDLRGVEDMSMRALSQDASLGRRLGPALARLDRVALVGDADWLDPLVSLQESAAPSLEVRRFTASDIDAARRWTMGRDEAMTPPAADGPSDGPSDGPTSRADGDAEPSQGARPAGAAALEGLFSSVFKAMESRSGERARDERSGNVSDSAGLSLEEHDGLLVLDLDGRVRREDVERVAARLDLAGKGERPMLARLTRFEGFDPAALLSPALWRLQNDGLSRLSRVALVTSLEWLGRAVESAARTQRVEVRRFSPESEAAARAWLNEGRTD